MRSGFPLQQMVVNAESLMSFFILINLMDVDDSEKWIIVDDN